jgi:ATP-binding cassette, subfamily B, multidrug efflux pump
MSTVENYLLADEQADGKNLVSDKEAFSMLFKECRPEALKFILGFALIVLSSIAVVYSGYRLGILFDLDLSSGNRDQIFWSVTFIIILETIHILFKWQGKRFFSYAAASTIFNIRKRLFDHFQNLSMSFFDRVPQGRIITRLTSDVDSMEDFFTTILANVLVYIMMASVAMVAMLLTDIKIGLMLTFAMIPILFLLYYSKTWVKKLSKEVSVQFAAMTSLLAEHINGIELIRARALEKWSLNLFNTIITKLLKAHLRSNIVYSFLRPLTSFLCVIPLLCLVYFGGQKVMESTLSVGMFIAFLRYCDRFYNPIVELSYQFHMIQKAIAGMERIIAFFKHTPEQIQIQQNDEIRPRINGEIRFDKVSFDYSTKKDILKNISFEIHSGEKVALVGKTGSGKTSIVSLLMRLYEYKAGSILLDGHDLRSFSLEHLREHIGIVTQEVVVFEGTVRDNLTNKKIVDDAEIISSCKKTGFWNVLQNNNMTLDSFLKNGGSNLSVGERQLLSITRIFLRKPAILILDEATANIDPAYELMIKKASQLLLQERTSLIIAHRLNTIQECDKVIVINQGEIEQVGTFHELSHLQGLFQQMYIANGPTSH